MDECEHRRLAYLKPDVAPRVRCRRCHLTIAEAELGDRPCPECFEESGTRRFEFDPVPPPPPPPTKMRCEDCGLTISA